MDRRSERALITSIESIRAHLDRGAPWEACDAFRLAIARAPDDAELLYWGALAHARAGATRVAHGLLDRAEAAASNVSPRGVDILCLRGRLWKDEFHRAPERAGAGGIAARALEQYLRAYAIGEDPYPGVNAATLLPV